MRPSIAVANEHTLIHHFASQWAQLFCRTLFALFWRVLLMRTFRPEFPCLMFVEGDTTHCCTRL